MTTTAIPHINIPNGRAQAALEFYRDVFDGELMTHTYAEFGMPADQPDAARIVYGQVTTADGFILQAYDIPGTDGGEGAGRTHREFNVTFTTQPFFITLRASSYPEIEKRWNRLKVGGDVVEELAASHFSPGFGMLTDQFGVTWIMNVHEDR